jgi:DHA1 family bicyclomycin/chloramphenicol resistance-like MFS transporter
VAEKASARAASSPLRVVPVLAAVIAIGPLSIDMYLPGLPALAASFRADPALGPARTARSMAGVMAACSLIALVAHRLLVHRRARPREL